MKLSNSASAPTLTFATNANATTRQNAHNNNGTKSKPSTAGRGLTAAGHEEGRLDVLPNKAAVLDKCMSTFCLLKVKPTTWYNMLMKFHFFILFFFLIPRPSSSMLFVPY